MAENLLMDSFNFGQAQMDRVQRAMAQRRLNDLADQLAQQNGMNPGTGVQGLQLQDQMQHHQIANQLRNMQMQQAMAKQAQSSAADTQANQIANQIKPPVAVAADSDAPYNGGVNAGGVAGLTAIQRSMRARGIGGNTNAGQIAALDEQRASDQGQMQTLQRNMDASPEASQVSPWAAEAGNAPADMMSSLQGNLSGIDAVRSAMVSKNGGKTDAVSARMQATPLRHQLSMIDSRLAKYGDPAAMADTSTFTFNKVGPDMKTMDPNGEYFVAKGPSGEHLQGKWSDWIKDAPLGAQGARLRQQLSQIQPRETPGGVSLGGSPEEILSNVMPHLDERKQMLIRQAQETISSGKKDPEMVRKKLSELLAQ